MRSLILCTFIIFLCGCTSQQIQDFGKGVLQSPAPTNTEMKLGIKEALGKGLQHAVSSLSVQDGFLKSLFKIPFPEDAQKIKTTLDKMGFQKLTNNIIVSLNRAAEDATKSAMPIFSSAIEELTLQDVVSIIKGEKNAATQFLRRTTESQLTALFLPKIQKSLNRVHATKYWNDAISRYNSIPFINKKNPDLASYVNGKAMNALFTQIAQEESAIRQDPVHRTTDLLKKVFGYFK